MFLVLQNLPHTRLPFSWSFTANCFTEIPQYLQTTLQVYSFVITSTFLFNEGLQNTLSHFTGVQSSFKWKNHSKPYVWLMGSQKAALIIRFDSHFICFYVKVNTHMFHSLGHHKYDMHHKHYSLLVMTAVRTCRNTYQHAPKKSCCSVISRYNRNELSMDTSYQAMYFNNFFFFHRYHVLFTFQAATSWQQ